jgi:sigma-B regulation protein RsbU (phosphoserine phosphatase)
LAGVLAVLVAVYMVAFGVMLKPLIERSVKQQIKLAAYESAHIAAQADLDAWSEFFGTEFQGSTNDEIRTAVEGMTAADYARRYGEGEVRLLRTWNKGRFGRLIQSDTRILAAEILSPDQRVLLASSHGSASEFEPVTDAPDFGALRGSSMEGVLVLSGQRHHAIRGSYPILGQNGQARGEMVVYIRAGAIALATSELMMYVAMAAGIFILVGIGVTWLVGQRMMRPIKLLQDDMRVVAGGDLEHRTSIHSGDEIGQLARSFDHMTQSMAEAQQLERDSAAGRHQLGVAAEVAASLYPTRLPEIDGYDLAGHHEASGQLAGEYYDVLQLPNGHWCLIVGSASGSGVPAAMVMAMARSFLAAVLRTQTDPGEALRQVNSLLSGDLRRGMYVTMLLAVLDPEQGTLAVANAGHSPLILARGKGLAPVHSEGIALGFDKGPVFDKTLKTVRLAIKPADRVSLYTPGITRVVGADGSALGDKRFAGLIKREAGHPASQFVRRIAATVKKFRGEVALSEDVTLLTLGRLADEGGEGA